MKGPIVESGPLLNEDRDVFNYLESKIDEYTFILEKEQSWV